MVPSSSAGSRGPRPGAGSGGGAGARGCSGSGSASAAYSLTSRSKPARTLSTTFGSPPSSSRWLMPRMPRDVLLQGGHRLLGGPGQDLDDHAAGRGHAVRFGENAEQDRRAGLLALLQVVGDVVADLAAHQLDLAVVAGAVRLLRAARAGSPSPPPGRRPACRWASAGRPPAASPTMPRRLPSSSASARTWRSGPSPRISSTSRLGVLVARRSSSAAPERQRPSAAVATGPRSGDRAPRGPRR